MNAVAVTVIAVAVLRLYLFANPSPPAEDLRAHRELGRVVAAEALRFAAGGGRLIVIGREISEFKVPAAQAQLLAFREAVKKGGKTVALERLAKVDPLRTLAVPAGEYFEVLRQAKEEDVIVSFLGPALLPADQLAKLGPKRAKVIAVCPHGMENRVDLAAVFQQGIVVAAIVGRPEAPAVPGPGDDRRTFDQCFKLVNQGNLADLGTTRAPTGGER